jgi:hypothetical protein
MAGKVGILSLPINAMFYPFPYPCFFVPALRIYFSLSGWLRHKKGGDNDLKKLRNGAKRNEAILTFFLLRRKGNKYPPCSSAGVLSLRVY